MRDLAFFPCWTSWGCSWPLLPTCKGLSSSSAAIPGLGGGTDPCSPSCSGNPTLVPPVALALGRAFTSMLRAAKCQSVELWVLVAPWPAPARHRPCWDTPRQPQGLFPALRAGSNVPGVSGGCGARALQGIVRVPALSPAAHGGCSWIIPAACWGLVRCKCWAAGEGQGEPCCQHTGCGSPTAGGAGIKTPVRPGRERHCPGSLLPAAEGEQSRGVS